MGGSKKNLILGGRNEKIKKNKKFKLGKFQKALELLPVLKNTCFFEKYQKALCNCPFFSN